MANALTGDFDVVAQFAIPAVNRVLAAMHRIERFPHSLSLRVKDVRRPTVTDTFEPSVVGVLDGFGDAVSDHDHIRDPRPLPGLLASTDPVHFSLDPVVNIGNAGILDEPIQPSNLQGRAQLQIFPPTIEVADSSGTNVSVHLQMLSKYLPDKNTSPAAEFIRGDLRITAPVHQVASQVANVVEIDIKANTVGINFTPQWSSKPLSAEDLTAINRLIRNALKTSFLPSNSTLPSNIKHMQFRTLQGAQSAVAALLNMKSGPGNRNSASTIFLDAGDDFAFGVGVDFVRDAFQPTLDKILATQVDPVSFTISGVVHTWHITYTVGLTSASVELTNGEIVLTVAGRATTPSWTPNFNFTATLKFTLEVDGDTANLVGGDVSLDTSSWIIDRFRGRGTAAIRRVRDRAIAQSGAAATIRKMLSAKENLGAFLDSLMKPARKKPGQPSEPPGFQLAYSSVEIRPVGIVLHGSVAVTPWPPAHVEFERIPASNQGPFGSVPAGGLNQGPDFSALKTWIPGGTVLRYEWKSQSPSFPGLIEENRFVYLNPGPGLSTGAAAAVVTGYHPLCVTVHGSRLSASGPVVRETVSATRCGVNRFPIGGEFASGDLLTAVALVEPTRDGLVEVAGHTSVARPSAEGESPNLVVHFGDQRSASGLPAIAQAVREMGRDDAPTAVLAVMSPDDLAKAPYVEGITYAEDRDDGWARRFGLRVAARPFTAIVSPNGKVVWQHEGPVEQGALRVALKKHVVAAKPVVPSLQPAAIRIGQAPPNFLFEYAAGREVTLRKVAGRPIILVFWRSTSRQSIELIRELEHTHAEKNGDAPLIIAINDGEPAELARRVAKESNLTANLATDSARSISRAYGVNTWPTTIGLDAAGIVRAVRFGRLAGDATESPAAQTKADYARNGQ